MKKTTDIIAYLKADKKRIFALLAAILGIALILFSGGEKKSEGGSSTLSEYKEELEEELTELCSSIDGVGKCKVTVTFSEGESVEYKGSNVTRQEPPKVMGVTVICEGGDELHVKREISECMTALFDIGSNRVCVLKMEK